MQWSIPTLSQDNPNAVINEEKFNILNSYFLKSWNSSGPSLSDSPGSNYVERDAACKRLYSLLISCCSILYVTFPGSTHSGWAHMSIASVIDYGLNILCPCMHCVCAKAYTSLTRVGVSQL